MRATRFRLPEGYAGLRDDYGAILERKRVSEAERQAETARAVGISREALSKIEACRAEPRPETMDRLLAHFELDWSAVAEKGAPRREVRPFDGSFRGDRAHELGRDIRRGRRLLGLGLREAAACCGMSASQLSRIERGQVRQARVFAPPTAAEVVAPLHDRPISLADDFLRNLAHRGALGG